VKWLCHPEPDTSIPFRCSLFCQVNAEFVASENDWQSDIALYLDRPIERGFAFVGQSKEPGKLDDISL
jgi:hypothetical protein